MKLGAIIEARMNSSRLPGKILYKAAGKSFLQHLIDRLKKIKQINKIVIATTLNSQDDALITLAKKNKILFFRGSENDVLSRVLGASKKFKIKNIVNITSDCPIIDVDIISQAIDTFRINKVDFVSNSDFRSYPDGMDVSICRSESLIKTYKMTKNKKYREHVTLFIKHNKRIFKQINIVAPKNIFWPSLGLTLDEYSDYVFLKKIIEYFYKKKNYFFKCHEIIDVLNKNRKWLKINSKVKRKLVKYQH